jgi:hypothetical protein
MDLVTLKLVMLKDVSMVRGNSFLRKLLLAGLLCATSVQWSHAQQFRLTVASPIAGNTPGFKDSLFVVRTDGCPEPAKAVITATGEGIVGGVRRSVGIEPVALSQPGAYAVTRRWLTDGIWVVVLTGSYRDMKAGAIVPIGPHGFLREPSKFFPRRAAPTEIDEALRTLAANGGTR